MYAWWLYEWQAGRQVISRPGSISTEELGSWEWLEQIFSVDATRNQEQNSSSRWANAWPCVTKKLLCGNTWYLCQVQAKVKSSPLLFKHQNMKIYRRLEEENSVLYSDACSFVFFSVYLREKGNWFGGCRRLRPNAKITFKKYELQTIETWSLGAC